MKTMLRAVLVAAAIAAFLTSKAQAQAPRVYSWTGPYVGANFGYQSGSVTNNSAGPSGALGGVQGGYNWQLNQFVFGGETDLQFSGADDVFAPWKFSNPWFGTLRGRAGFAVNNIFFYGTLGLAYGTLRAQNTVTGVMDPGPRSAGPAVSAWRWGFRAAGPPRSSISTSIFPTARSRSPARATACSPTSSASA